MPDAGVDWLAFRIATNDPSYDSAIYMDASNNTHLDQAEQLEVQLSVYGPNADDTCRLIRDNLDLDQNRAQLVVANMGLVGVGKAMHIPELINERVFQPV